MRRLHTALEFTSGAVPFMTPSARWVRPSSRENLVTTSKEGDFPGKTSPSAITRPPITNAWDFADRLIERIASATWTWSRTLQLCLLFAILIGGLGWVGSELTAWPSWAIGAGAGAAGAGAGVAAYKRRSAISAVSAAPGAPPAEQKSHHHG
jgi:hypothetical protein